MEGNLFMIAFLILIVLSILIPQVQQWRERRQSSQEE